ncbi:hypothetical protein BV898_15265 [Hypsibius exemplaris]|uniref:G-protein coupled receptors family 1 profile domain-containing protein n=1 Tax=Hypsibius exemplaris TaxID=2072580 RepID=A0A9X6NCB3_HYPEX|nr:hypothetical protein BV898_15265 [Hypsibius exemplaris]
MSDFYNNLTIHQMNVSTQNTSDNLTSSTAVWGSSASFSLTILLITVLANLFVLSAFVCHKSLQTPFHVYLINLLVTYLAYAVLFMPLEVITNLYTTWWLGSAVCTYSIYGIWVFQAGMINSHLLITINRIWAVTFPHSYRLRHTGRVALLSVAGMWICLHCALLPGIILDAMYYRLPEDRTGCMINTNDTLGGWSMAVQIVIYDVPDAIILLAYPIICYQTFVARRARLKHMRVSHLSSVGTVQRPHSVGPSEQPAPRLAPKGAGHAFTLLTVMTFCILLCYFPNQVYYTAIIFYQDNWPGFFRISCILFDLAGVIDPLFAVLTFRSLRSKLRRLFRYSK